MFATRIILRKIKQFDAQGLAYDRDILIETILKQIKQDFPLDITANFRYLKGTRDPRIRDYVASFLDHEMELVRKAAAETLPTVEPDEGQRPGKVDVSQAAPSDDRVNGSNEEPERLRGRWWIVVVGVAALVLLMAAGIGQWRHRAWK